MPMIDVYAATGTFGDKHKLAWDLAAAVASCMPVFNPLTLAAQNNLYLFPHSTSTLV
jgi:hypothetical protein